MIKNLLHLTLLTVIWKKYRSMILSTLVLFGYFFLISLLHDDYLSYSELNQTQQQYLGISFIVKWLAFLLGLLIYLYFNFGFLWRRQERSSRESTRTRRSTETQGHNTAGKPETTVKADPFADIRNRDKLRSRADFLIEKKDSNNEQ